jgi:hypothetical protein
VEVKPLVTFSADDLKFIDSATKELENAPSMDVLKGYAEILVDKPKAIQDVLRPLYAKRQKQISQT